MSGRHQPENGADSGDPLLAYIDQRLANVEAELGDDETLQSIGRDAAARLRERRATLLDVRAWVQR